MDGIRPRSSAPRGRHFLRPRIAADLVRNSGVTRGDLVLELGAGTGILTRELARRAGRVVAVEIDAGLSARLRRRFADGTNVRVIEGDALEVSLPQRPFRVVANLPFGRGTAILRRLLDDPAGPLLRADVVVEWGLAVKRCSQRPSTMLTISWAPWFELTITRRVPAWSFHPAPRVDAAVMTITRRPDPLLPPGARADFAAFLEAEFRARSDASDLDVWHWVREYAS